MERETMVRWEKKSSYTRLSVVGLPGVS